MKLNPFLKPGHLVRLMERDLAEHTQQVGADRRWALRSCARIPSPAGNIGLSDSTYGCCRLNFVRRRAVDQVFRFLAG